MTAKTTLLQTIVSADVGEWVRGQALKNGQTVAAWLRTILETQRENGPRKSHKRRIDELERRVARIERT